jgi:SAM-dependent methyltransferase
MDDAALTSGGVDVSVIQKLRKARRRVRDHGLRSTIRWALASTFYHPITRWRETRFDRKYGTDTTISVDPSGFDVDEELRTHAIQYVASPVRSFVRFLKEQDLDYSRYTFVDLGCGKGRTLLLASLLFPFKRVIGVEFEPRLHAICTRNIEIFARHADLARAPEAVCMSAGRYQFPGGDILLYLFNPFDEHVMNDVAENLRSAIESEPRHVRVIYSHPNADAPLLKLPALKLLRSERFRDRSSLNGVGRLNTYDLRSRLGSSARRVI